MRLAWVFPVWLMPGVSRLNASTYFFCAFIFVTLVTFLNIVQPYILKEILHVPLDTLGSVTGYLNFLQEGTALIVMGIVGAISDRTGRRTLLITGFLIWTAAFILFPLAGSLGELYMYRLVFAVGVATASVMVIAIMQDFPQNMSRGKWGGFNSFLTSFSILFVLIGLATLPGIFTSMGYTPVQAGRYTFWVGAGLTLFAAVVFRLGFSGARAVQKNVPKSPLEGFATGLRAARTRPGLALAYISAFAARGDMVVLTAFYSLWFVHAAPEQGIDTATALRIGGQTMATLILANLLWAPTFGFILDRINRVIGLCVAMMLAALGYFVLGSVSDPYNMPVMMGATFVLGIGEISVIVVCNALLGQEAPPKVRGAASGVFGLLGTVGILTATLAGGLVFDAFGPGAPFKMMAVVNGVVAVFALCLILSGGHRYRPHTD
ncbi:MAG TPA: MFS transporter [Gammaproteobacteria bacterium]|jgi:MFS family permease|nr:MFS transporter [Gammaproteobacteria bacterium]